MMKKFCLALLVLALAWPAMAGGPGNIHFLTPCRWFDTRIPGCVVGGGCWEGPFVDQQIRGYIIRGGAECLSPGSQCCVPAEATGIILHVVVTESTGNGNLLVYSGTALERPRTTSINFKAGHNTSNTTVVELGVDPGPPSPVPLDLKIYARVSGGGMVHAVIDILGYIAPRED